MLQHQNLISHVSQSRKMSNAAIHPPRRSLEIKEYADSRSGAMACSAARWLIGYFLYSSLNERCVGAGLIINLNWQCWLHRRATFSMKVAPKVQLHGTYSSR